MVPFYRVQVRSINDSSQILVRRVIREKRGVKETGVKIRRVLGPMPANFSFGGPAGSADFEA